MKNILAILVVCFSLATFSVDADAARRFGGGMTKGRAAPTIIKKDVAPAPGVQTNRANRQQATNANAARQQTRPQQRPSMMRNVLMGIAGALGITALLSMLGLGGSRIATAIASALLIGLIVFAALAFFGKMRAKQRPRARGAGRYAGTYRESTGPVSDTERPAPSAASAYAASSSARPGSVMDEFSSPAQSHENGERDITPNDFDREAFLQVARENYAKLQKAWDDGNLQTIADYTTPDLLQQLMLQSKNRKDEPQTSEIEELKAELIGIVEQGDEYVALLFFTGRICVNGEVEKIEDRWIMTKPREGRGGWLLAGIESAE